MKNFSNTKVKILMVKIFWPKKIKLLAKSSKFGGQNILAQKKTKYFDQKTKF